jgi:phosphoribosylamine--glycine ligase
LATVTIDTDPRAVASIILVAGGYPGDYAKGHPITGIESVTDSFVFHAGTRQVGDAVVTNGGRVLAITSYGDTYKDALATSLANAAKIHFQDAYYRSDIGFDL